MVRFAPGEVEPPEESPSGEIPIENVVVRSDQLRIALLQVGVTGVSLVCRPWRNLRAPQYDINGEEIPIQQMVDYADVYKLGWSGSASSEEVRSALVGLPEVIYAEIMAPLQLDYEPNDAYFDDQWGLNNEGQTYPDPCVPCSSDVDVNAPEAWEHQDSCRVKIGIIDHGFDYDHEESAEAYDPNLHWGLNDGEEPDNYGWPHGSAVAGIVGATGGNSVGISGVASPRGGRILVSMRAIGDQEDPLKIAEALAWATSDSVFPAIAIVTISPDPAILLS